VTMTNGAYPHYLTGYFKIYLKRLPERASFGIMMNLNVRHFRKVAIVDIIAITLPLSTILLLDCRIVPKVLYILCFILPDSIFGFIIYLHPELSLS